MKQSFIWISTVIIFSIIVSNIVTYRIARAKIIRVESKLEQRFEQKFDTFRSTYLAQKTMLLDNYLQDKIALHQTISETDTTLPQTDEEIALQRTKAMNTTISILEKERDTHGGSWDAWYLSLNTFHEDMRKVLRETPEDVVKMGMFPTQDGYIYAQKALKVALREDSGNFRQDEKPVISPVASLIHLDREFKDRGIDFIYVPIPMNLDVYPEHISENYPKNDIAAPYLRKMFHALLKADVEVIDLMPTYLDAKRDQPDINLYLEKDIHWSSDAVQITASYIARRLQRYPFVRATQEKTQFFRTKDVSEKWYGKYMSKLENREQYPLRDYITRRVFMPDGKPYTDSEDPEIIIMGDSFAYYFHVNYGKNGGIAAHLARFTGVSIKQITTSGMMPIELNRRFKELLSPSVKLVLYIQDSRQLYYGDGWKLVHFPKDE